MNSGITAVMMGSDCTMNSINENPETMRLRPRDSTYPAGAATATDTTTVTTVTVKLFFSQVKTSVWLKMLTKFSSVNFAVLVLPRAGWRERRTTAMIGTSTTAVITKMTTNRHQVPRFSGSTLRRVGATLACVAFPLSEIAAVLIGSAPSESADTRRPR